MRTILNFLVNSSKGTVFLKSIDASHFSKIVDKVFRMMNEIVEEVGEENTPKLEDFERKIPIHKETIEHCKKVTTYIYSRTSLISLLHYHTNGTNLIRPAATRFAISYLTLGCLVDTKQALITMFTSNEWTSSQCAKTKDGRFVENVVIHKEFWNNIVVCLKGAYPLIKVLRLVDSNEKSVMSFIYEATDQAKEKIQIVFNDVKKSYLPIWEIINQRWDTQLHRPLHAASYYLNPKLHYDPNFKADIEVKRRLYDCLTRMVGNMEEIGKIDDQHEDFKNKYKFFGSPIAIAGIKTKTSSQWCEFYGDEHPELQNSAIRVLSLTCSSSGCERNWSAFEMVHAKRRNRLMQKTMNDVVYVMTNSKLAKKKFRKANEYSMDDVDSNDDWIVENKENSYMDASNDEEFFQVGQDTYVNDVVGASLEDIKKLNLDHLNIPNFDNDGDEEAMDEDD
ncbi:hypothetical protein Lal_00041589 [Lupinus albus]|nr:hypothetical protein Lal_00041589 [Lupinus albus]